MDLGKEGQLLYLGRQEVVIQEAARVAAVLGGRRGVVWGRRGGGGREGGEGRGD